MAKKKRKSTRKKQAVRSTPKHELPSGFWSQVSAVGLIVISVLFMIAWFRAGGPILEWLHDATLATIGYSIYILPAVFIYLAIEIFRAEDNKTPFLQKFASLFSIILLSGLFGVLSEKGGGFIGDLLNSGVLLLVDNTVAAFLYIMLIIVTLFVILQVLPQTVISRLWGILRPQSREQDANIKVMRAASELEKAPASEFKLKASVPTLDHRDDSEETKSNKRSSFRNSVVPDKAAEERSALVTVTDPNWQAPSLDLLEKKQSPADAGDVQHNAQVIKETLREFNIDVDMEGANIGPKVTQYTLRPPSGVKLTRITALETNLALNLAAPSLRIEAPIPGQRAVGIEVPNRKAADVRLHGILTSRRWKAATEPLSFVIGKDISGEAVIGELNKMPHLLIAGQTGAGKSVMINTLLSSLLYRNSPSEMKLILVDPKQVEMAAYQDIPHLITPVITEPEKTISALKWAVNEMERRYSLLAEHRIKDIKSYNQKLQAGRTKIAVTDEEGVPQKHEDGAMPYIVIVVDELADLMMVAARDVEALIVRLAQKARAVGIHLVLATQRPSVNVITGLIKANIPARIAFTVTSQIDSRTILDQPGAEKLLGQGDMLLSTPSMSKPQRIQGALITDEEIHKIVAHLQLQSPPQYNDEVVSQPVQINGKGGVVMDFDTGGDDDMFKDAVRVVVESGKASTSLLQRRLRIGYSRAARIMEDMEDRGIIGPADGSRPREVLISSADDLGDSAEQDY